MRREEIRRLSAASKAARANDDHRNIHRVTSIHRNPASGGDAAPFYLIRFSRKFRSAISGTRVEEFVAVVFDEPVGAIAVYRDAAREDENYRSIAFAPAMRAAIAAWTK